MVLFIINIKRDITSSYSFGN